MKTSVPGNHSTLVPVNQRKYVMLFGDNHVEFYGFPREILSTAPVNPANPYW